MVREAANRPLLPLVRRHQHMVKMGCSPWPLARPNDGRRCGARGTTRELKENMAESSKELHVGTVESTLFVDWADNKEIEGGTL